MKKSGTEDPRIYRQQRRARVGYPEQLSVRSWPVLNSSVWRSIFIYGYCFPGQRFLVEESLRDSEMIANQKEEKQKENKKEEEGEKTDLLLSPSLSSSSASSYSSSSSSASSFVSSSSLSSSL